MKQQEEMLSPNEDINSNDMEVEFSSTDDMTEDMVEDFARQLDEVVRIQDAQGGHGESDEEDEEAENDHFGYQKLPQDDEGDEMYQQLQLDDEEGEEKEEDIKNPLDIDLEPSARLNPETSDLIKSIMTNIQLSNDAVPDWAKKIPESAWLPRVIEKDE